MHKNKQNEIYDVNIEYECMKRTRAFEIGSIVKRILTFDQ